MHPLNAVLLGKRRDESDVPSVLCNEDVCLNPASRTDAAAWHSSWSSSVSSLSFSSCGCATSPIKHINWGVVVCLEV